MRSSAPWLQVAALEASATQAAQRLTQLEEHVAHVDTKLQGRVAEAHEAISQLSDALQPSDLLERVAALERTAVSVDDVTECTQDAAAQAVRTLTAEAALKPQSGMSASEVNQALEPLRSSVAAIEARTAAAASAQEATGSLTARFEQLKQAASEWAGANKLRETAQQASLAAVQQQVQELSQRLQAQEQGERGPVGRVGSAGDAAASKLAEQAAATRELQCSMQHLCTMVNRLKDDVEEQSGRLCDLHIWAGRLEEAMHWRPLDEDAPALRVDGEHSAAVQQELCDLRESVRTEVGDLHACVASHKVESAEQQRELVARLAAVEEHAASLQQAEAHQESGGDAGNAVRGLEGLLLAVRDVQQALRALSVRHEALQAAFEATNSERDTSQLQVAAERSAEPHGKAAQLSPEAELPESLSVTCSSTAVAQQASEVLVVSAESSSVVLHERHAHTATLQLINAQAVDLQQQARRLDALAQDVDELRNAVVAVQRCVVQGDKITQRDEDLKGKNAERLQSDVRVSVLACCLRLHADSSHDRMQCSAGLRNASVCLRMCRCAVCPKTA